MAKCKYDTNTFPLLAEGYARDGMRDEDISAKLGISIQTYYDYQKKFPEFFDALKRGKAPVDIEVESALLKRAIGFDYDEVKTETIINEKGKESKFLKKTVTKKMIPPDTGAAFIWLKNRMPKKWRDKTNIEHSGEINGGVVFEIEGV